MSEGDKSSEPPIRQLTRHRGVALLLALALTVLLLGFGYFLVHQDEHADERQSAAEYSVRYERQKIEIECNTPTARSRTLSCIADSPDTGGEEQRADADLHAQQQMAEWAFAMFVASAAGVVVTFAGVAYVAMTLGATREAVVAANKANATAESTLAETTRIGEAQTRAYLAPSEASVSLDGNRFSLYAKFLNSGVTPAKSPEFSWQIAVFTGDVSKHEYQRAMLKIRSHGNWRGLTTMFDAGSNLTIEETLKTAEIPADVLSTLETEVVHIELSGSLRYGTIFKPGQTTETFNVEFALPSTSLASLRTKGRKMLPRSLDQAFNALREGRYWRGPEPNRDPLP
jgi:hypothetical protein